MNNGIISERLITQGNHSPGDAVSLGVKILKVTVYALPTSQQNVLIGWGQPASQSNLIEPGQSVTYYDQRVYLDGNNLYIDFDTTGSTSGGQALISVIMDSDQKNCR